MRPRSASAAGFQARFANIARARHREYRPPVGDTPARSHPWSLRRLAREPPLILRWRTRQPLPTPLQAEPSRSSAEALTRCWIVGATTTHAHRAKMNCSSSDAASAVWTIVSSTLAIEPVASPAENEFDTRRVPRQSLQRTRIVSGQQARRKLPSGFPSGLKEACAAGCASTSYLMRRTAAKGKIDPIRSPPEQARFDCRQVRRAIRKQLAENLVPCDASFEDLPLLRIRKRRAETSHAEPEIAFRSARTSA